MEWISIKDRLPQEGQLVLILLDRRKPYKEDMIHLNGFCIWPQRTALYIRLNPKIEIMFIDEYFRSYSPTHWMPLPETPK